MSKSSALAALILFLVSGGALPDAAAAPPQKGASEDKEIPLGRLVDPGGAHLVVRREYCRCEPVDGEPEIVFLTVGAELPGEGEAGFHPVASFAFDRSLSDSEPGHWLGLWIYGPSGSHAGRHIAAWIPAPLGGPGATRGGLARLEKKLERLRAGEDGVRGDPPAAFLDLTEVGRFPRTSGVAGVLKRVLNWVDVYNPAQLFYRSYMTRRKDRSARNFQRAYVALLWLLDAEFDRNQSTEWLVTMNDLRYHLLRTRSPFGRFLPMRDSWDMVLGYEGTVRERLGKSSAWLQGAANEHFLRYEPIYRGTPNGRGIPFGGVLYYDPRLPDGQDPGWWHVANPFDLPYNPHKHREVQRLAKENPDKWIPLAVYTYQTELRLIPTITIDFFSPGNPRMRERNGQLMRTLGQWLAVVTGPLSIERLPYRGIMWAANKKGETLLASRSPRLGVEELRLAIETGMYFDPESLDALLRHADKRILNPLIKPAAVERLLASLQYEGLRQHHGRKLCRQVAGIRKEMLERYHIAPDLPVEEQRTTLARRLVTSRQMLQLRMLAGRATGDYGSLEKLGRPLDFFQQAQPPYPKNLLQVVSRTYRDLHKTEMKLSDGHGLPELDVLKTKTRTLWQRVAEQEGKDFEGKIARVERRVQRRLEKDRREGQERQAKELRTLLKETRKQLKLASKGGCDPNKSSPADLELLLTLLRDVAQVASLDQPLRDELNKQRVKLRRSLLRVETTLSRCSAGQNDLWRAEAYTVGRQMARSVIDVLDQQTVADDDGGN